MSGMRDTKGKERRMKDNTQEEQRVEKDKGLVYEDSSRASPPKLQKNRYVTGSWEQDEVYRKGIYEKEMRVEDENKIEGGNGGRKRGSFMHDWWLR